MNMHTRAVKCCFFHGMFSAADYSATRKCASSLYTVQLDYNAKPRSILCALTVFYYYSRLHSPAFQCFVLKSECSQLSSTPPRSLWGSFTTSPGIITRFSFSPSFSLLNALPLGSSANYRADFLLLSILYQIAYAIGGDQRNAKHSTEDKKLWITIISHVY